MQTVNHPSNNNCDINNPTLETLIQCNCEFICKAIRNSRVTVCFQMSVAILPKIYRLSVLLLARPIYPCWNSPRRVAAQQQQQHKLIRWQRLGAIRAGARMLLLRSIMLGVEQRASAEESVILWYKVSSYDCRRS